MSKMANEEIEKLIGKILAGDTDAIEQFVNQYQSLFSVVAYSIIRGNPYYSAEDLCQDGLIELICGKEGGSSRLAKWEPKGSFDYWLRRTFYRLCIDILRKELPGAKVVSLNDILQVTDTDVEDEVEDEALRDEKCQAVQHCMSLLTEEQRTILEMKYLEKLSLQNIADILDVPVTTIKMRLYYARKGLRKCLGKKYSALFPR